MRLVTYNINSIRKRPHIIQDLLLEQKLDIIALQETKISNLDMQEFLPKLNLRDYNMIYSGQKAYNGVAIIFNKSYKLIHSCSSLYQFYSNYAEERFMHLQLYDPSTNKIFNLINIYTPQGQNLESQHYVKKLLFLHTLYGHIAPLINTPLILMGDFNICPQDQDVYNIDLFKNQNMCSQRERQFILQLKALGLADNLEKFNHNIPTFTWWDHRANSFTLNKGLRIDHIFTNSFFNIEDCRVLKNYRAMLNCSDHAPLLTQLHW